VDILCFASERGIVNQIKEILQSENLDILKQNINNFTVLAVQNKQEETALLYLEIINKKFPDLITRNQKKHQSFSNLGMIAAQKSANQFLKKLYTLCPDLVNFQSNNGATALHVATVSGNFQTAKMLIDDFGANANCRDEKGLIPLHCAAQNGNSEMVDLLSNYSDGQATTNNKYVFMDPCSFSHFQRQRDTFGFGIHSACIE
jgi:ankyrin repeat protein